jgi:hypothetical protein
MIDLREFRGHINLRAAAIIRALDPFADPPKLGVQLRGWLIALLIGDPIPGPPEILVLALEKGSDEIVLSSEMPVKARFGYSGLLDHEINPNRSDPVPIKEGTRGFEDSAPHFGVAVDV